VRLDDNDRQVKVQVLPELPAGGGLLHAPIRGRDDAGVALDLQPAPDALEALHLERRRQLTIAAGNLTPHVVALEHLADSSEGFVDPLLTPVDLGHDPGDEAAVACDDERCAPLRFVQELG